jgi:hypothetical protein
VSPSIEAPTTQRDPDAVNFAVVNVASAPSFLSAQSKRVFGRAARDASSLMDVRARRVT